MTTPADQPLMPDGRDRLNKVLTLAMHPQTLPEEAIAAFHRARELVKANPSLAHPRPAQKPTPAARPSPEANFRATITAIHPDWVLILVSLLSKRAYELDMRHRIDFDFSQALTSLTVQCDGSRKACEGFEWTVNWAVGYINDQLKKPK